ncbi:MAG: hypothetical protein IH598_01240 [Bacteroidales bacterium]|nr:hypothetical protein [Bacteroidales bacterium]
MNQLQEICRLPTGDYHLPTADCRLGTADWGLPTAGCRLGTANWGLPTTNFQNNIGIPTSFDNFK